MRRRREARVALVLAVLLAASPAPAIASTGPARVGSVLDLTPHGGVDTQSSPVVAIGKDGRTVVAWTAVRGLRKTLLEVRTGPAADRLGPPRTLADDVSGVGFGSDVIATVGPDGTAAVAWPEPGTHNTRLLVRTAGPGRAFGPARDVSGRDDVQQLNGVGVDDRGRILISWADDGPGCCDSGIDRYSVAAPGGPFDPPRTGPLTDGGDGQVLQTADGGLAISSGDKLFQLNQNSSSLTALPAPPGDDINGSAAEFAVGPSGLVASLYSNAAPPSLDSDIGIAALPTGGPWSSPVFVPNPPLAGDQALPGDNPAVTVGSDGSVVLAGSFGTRVGLSREQPTGALGPFVTLMHSSAGQGDESLASDPQIAAFGSDLAVDWVTWAGARETLHLATTHGTSSPSVRTLGAGSDLTGPALSSNADSAAVAWAANRHVWLWYAG